MLFLIFRPYIRVFIPKRPICLISIIRRYSAATAICRIYREKTGEPFTIDIKIIRRRIGAIGKNKSVGPDRVSGEILKLGGEAMIPYLARLLDNNE